MRVKTIALLSASVLGMSSPNPAAAQAVPAQTVPAQTAPAEPEPVPGEDSIVVTGYRASLQSAQNIKRNADQIVDVIVAEDIGKLPDITASASLARITGVQVTRAAGEAADVQVRGLPDLSTTYNGREIFTAENRNVALQDFPAGGVAALEVFKSSTANLIEGGIAGQINVRSRRPFDFAGLEIFGSAAGVYTEQAQKIGLNGNLLVSSRWDTGMGEIGVLLNGSYVETKFLDSTREQSTYIPAATAGQSSTPGFVYPDATATYFGQGDRTRPSANGAIQWQPSPELVITFDGLFQGYRGRDYNRYLFVPIFGDGLSLSNVTLIPGTNQAQSLTASGGNAPDGYTEFVNADTDTYQFGGNVTWTGDRLQVAADVAYTQSTYTSDQANIDYVYSSTPTRDVTFESDGADGGPTFSFQNFDVNDANNYIFRGLYEFRTEAKGDDIQGRLDLDYEADLGFVSRLYAGVRYSDRDASRQRGSRYAGQTSRGIRYGDALLGLDYELSDPGFTYNDVQSIKRWVVPTRDSVWNNIEGLRTLVGFDPGPPEYDDVQAFTANEKSYTGYGQLKYAFDVGFPIDGLIGLRAVQTETGVTGTSRIVSAQGTTFEPTTVDTDYVDYLPNASLRIELQPGLQLRAAFTETRTRARFDQLNPSTQVGSPPSCATDDDPSNDANCFRGVSSGNPNLRPLVSTNYDLSLEYYFRRAGFASVALFRRDVNGFISDSTVRQTDPEYGQIELTRPDNGGDGFLQGVEVSFSGFLDFGWVPQWAQGFGLQGNYTYIESGSELAPSLVNSTTLGNLYPGQPKIADVSEHSFNVIGLYEISEFSARLAYNWRSDYVEEYQRFFDPVASRERIAPLMQEARGVLDFSASVTPLENVTLAFDATNLLATPIKTYREYDGAGSTYSRARKYLERIYALTLRLRY